MKLSSIVTAFALGTGILAATLSMPAYAYNYLNSSQHLLQILNDRDASANQINFLSDAQGVGQGISYLQDSGNSDFSLAQVKAGAVLEAQQGINALTVKGAIDPQSGGTLNFIYISNGMMGQYKTCAAILRRGNGGEWQLFNSYTHTRVQSVKFITWQFGITTIQGLCPN